MKTDKIKTLRPKQALFVSEYLIDLNATQAALRAGYASKRADQIGFENLRKPEIQAQIQAEMNKRAASLGLTAEKVLKDIDAIKKNAMRLGKTGDMADPKAALKACELEGKHLKMFTDNINLAGKDDGPIEIMVKRERVEINQ